MSDGEPDRPKWEVALAALEGAYSEQTIRGYTADFRVFARWCANAAESPLPASGKTLEQFVNEGMAGCAPATLRRRLVAIRKVHRLFKLDDAVSSEEVQLAVRRRLRLNGRRQDQALGLTGQLRDQLLAACGDTRRGRRDRAMISVGYDLLARRSELVGLQAEDLVRLPDGSGKILIRRGKTDPLSEGRFGYLSARAVDHLQRWLESAAIDAGPVFRPVFGGVVGAGPMHPVAVNRTLKAAAARANLDNQVVCALSGHSMRVGAAQDLVVAGRSVLQIMTAGRWTNLNVVGGYARDADFNIWNIPAQPWGAN